MQLLAARQAEQNAYSFKAAEASRQQVQQAQNEATAANTKALQLQRELLQIKQSHAAAQEELWHARQQHIALNDKLNQATQGGCAAHSLLQTFMHAHRHCNGNWVKPSWHATTPVTTVAHVISQHMRSGTKRLRRCDQITGIQ